jgi:RNA polymerase sigma-70 factor (ECF subfamily)
MHTLTDLPTAARRARADHDDLDQVAVAFVELRPRLLAIAARVLRDIGDPDDIVQDAWIRWQLCDRSEVANATAFLVTATTRLAINAAQSARSRRETTVGDWTPEPADQREEITARPERDEATADALDLLVRRLPPAERAAYILRRGFDYGYTDIADLLGVSAVNARQLVSRGHKHLSQDRRLDDMASEDRARLLGAVTTAARHGDLGLLERTLVSRLGEDVPFELAA